MPDKTTHSNLGGALDAIVITEGDNVAVCLHDIESGAEASIRLGKDNFAVTATNPVPRGHKLAVRDIAEGESVLKYGEVIGKASQNIGTGNHVHVHNVVD
ncbi:MAG: UxaA family hydrolase [Alphaproteobacteria bacterium]|nr:UxaA family hydrolase [Alphaproteobacteria bacterium]